MWSRVVRQIVTRAEDVGVPRTALLERAGLSEADLGDAEARVPLACTYAALEAMEELSGDPFVHMRVTRAFELDSLEALAFVVMTSATLRTGIRAMLKYQRLFSDGERYELSEAGGWGRLSYHPWGPTRRAHALMAEMFAVDVAVNGAVMTGAPFDRPRVRFAHAPPDDRAAHRAHLGGIEAEFDCATNEVWIASHDLDRRLAPEGREAVSAFFERHLDEKIRALSSTSLAGRARDLLVRDVATLPSVNALAKKLRMSARTLQRRLGEEGTTVRKLADEARLARAIPLLEAGHAITEIAYLLGFTDPSAFHRAFRRWTGKTPEGFRRGR